MSDLDLLLFREIKDGKIYEPLIPKVTGELVGSGDGETDYSVREMSKLVKRYSWQMQKVAALLEKGSLIKTCDAIHYFCYWHFQYKADTDTQRLRTPANSWRNRRDGIDCKSYSIIASSLLTCMGISHYIRKVKQPTFYADLWTHVYVIVPVDQVKGDISKGYYVIDGTVATERETIYTEKSDLYMKHEMLNGAGPNYIGTRGLRASVANGNANQQGLNGFSLNEIKNLFSGNLSLKSLSCIGGTYQSKDFDVSLGKIVPWFDDMFYQINNAVRDNSPTVMTLVNKLLTDVAKIRHHSEKTSQKNWSSDCSKKATAAYRDLGLYYFNIVTTTFLAWLETYFNVTYTTTTGFNNTFEVETRVGDKGFKKQDFVFAIGTIKNVQTISLKPTTAQIMRFEVTAYAAKAENYGSGFNVGQALQGLTTVLAIFTPQSSGSGNTSGGSGSVDYSTGGGGSGYTPVNNSNKVTTAGKGIGGFLILAAGAALIFTGMPDEPTKAVATVAQRSVAKQRKTSTIKKKR